MKCITLSQFLTGNYVIELTEMNVRLLLQVNFPNFLKDNPREMTEVMDRWAYIYIARGMIHYRGGYSDEVCRLIVSVLRKV